LFVQDDGEREGNIAGKTRNFQNVEIKDGNWTVDGGEMGSGNTVIRGGAVLVVPGGFHLRPGGRLGGNGTLRSDLVNEGTVAPGESIGTLTIDGTYTHVQNGILEVETRADGDTDQLSVTGTATLLGGTVQVLPDDHVRNYRGKTVSYDILVAEGGIDGQFAESTTPFLFLRSGLSYKDEPAGGNTAVLELTGLS